MEMPKTIKPNENNDLKFRNTIIVEDGPKKKKKVVIDDSFTEKAGEQPLEYFTE